MLFSFVKQGPKKRKEKVQMKEIDAGTEYQYGDVNIQMTSYDLCLVEHFAQYVHRLCNRLSIRVNERYEEICPSALCTSGHTPVSLRDSHLDVNPNLSRALCSPFV